MYHISKDRRALNSSQAIYQGLLQCLEEKPFDHITISDLQKASGVARTTFYRSFDNISDVLYWQCDTCFMEVLDKCASKLKSGPLEFAKQYFAYWMEHSDILELLIRINRQDIIYACHMKNAERLQEKFGPMPGMVPEHGRYFVAVRTGFTISVLTTWLQGGRKETPEELIEIIKEQFSCIPKLKTNEKPA